MTPKHVVQNYMKHTNTLYRIHSVVRQVVPYTEVAIDFKDVRNRGAVLPFLQTYSSSS